MLQGESDGDKDGEPRNVDERGDNEMNAEGW